MHWLSFLYSMIGTQTSTAITGSVLGNHNRRAIAFLASGKFCGIEMADSAIS